ERRADGQEHGVIKCTNLLQSGLVDQARLVKGCPLTRKVPRCHAAKAMTASTSGSGGRHGRGTKALHGLPRRWFPLRAPSRRGQPLSAARASLTLWIALALLSVGLTVASAAFSVVAAAPAPLVPDPTLTPGDVLTTDPTVVCQPGYTATVRDVPQSLKNQVYRQ